MGIKITLCIYFWVYMFTYGKYILKKIKRKNQSNRRQENTGYIFSRFLESTSKDISVENSAKKNFQPSCRTGISIS